MESTYDLGRYVQKEFNLPYGKEVTKEYDDAARQVIENNQDARQQFPTLTMVNRETGESVTEIMDAATLLLERKLPVTEYPYVQPNETSRRIMGRLSLMQLKMVERIGLNPYDAAILVPLMPQHHSYRRHCELASAWDDHLPVPRLKNKITTVIGFQGRLDQRFGRQSLYGQDGNMTFEVEEIPTEKDARAGLSRVLATRGFELIKTRQMKGMEEDAPAFMMVDADGRRRFLESANTYRIAAVDSLVMIKAEGEKLFRNA